MPSPIDLKYLTLGNAYSHAAADDVKIGQLIVWPRALTPSEVATADEVVRKTWKI
jgi:hypothetical protein